QVEDELEPGRLLDRDVPRLRAAQNLVNKLSGAAKHGRNIWSIGHKPSLINVLSLTENSRESCVERQGDDAHAVSVDERISTDIKRVCGVLERRESRRNMLFPLDFVWGDSQTERGSRCLNFARVIGFFGVSTPSTDELRVAAFVQRLRELGWIEGRTVAIEYRWAEGRTGRFAEIAAELARLKVDVIVTAGAAPVFAAKQATSLI